MADEKVYEPEIVPDNPFPSEVISPVLSQNKSLGEGNYAPAIAKEKTFPKKRTAVELLSNALNTRSKKILQEFALTQFGGLKIGDFKEGLSGDIRITPNGITARDIAGLTTFSIDGSDGSAAFRGQIQSGSLITGEVVVGNNRVIIDVDENEEPTIIVNDGSNDRVLIGFQANGF